MTETASPVPRPVSKTGVPSYGKVLNLGYRHTEPVLDGRPVYIQEKIDGSQFSALLTGAGLAMRSKNRAVDSKSSSLFAPAASWFKANIDRLRQEHVYRCEAVAKRHHNQMHYDRAPECGFVLWDIEFDDGVTMDGAALEVEAARLGVAFAPWLHSGPPQGPDSFVRKAWYTDFLERHHKTGGLLGGGIEGIVIKPIEFALGPDGKRLAVKALRPEFKEDRSRSFRNQSTGPLSKIEEIGARFAQPARYRKALEAHLESKGVLSVDDDGPDPALSMRDIGPMIRWLQDDIDTECADLCKDLLWAAFRKDILRHASQSFAAWFKEQLAKTAGGGQVD